MENKAKDVKEFVERIDGAKKLNPKDLSSDQDLTIALMNLISIEEHLIFSGAKTGKTAYYDLIEDIRELRKNLMEQVIPQYEGEVWCISKHLLAASMRLMEVGTKQQSLQNHEKAYKLFDQAYELYCLFWGLNLDMLNIEELKWVEDNESDIKKISDKLEAYKADTEKDMANQATGKKLEAKVGALKQNDKPVVIGEEKEPEARGFMGKMKQYVRKAIDCCIE